MADLIERPRVERCLREAVAHAPLTLLHAPLGAGKTSVVHSAFRSLPGVVWMDARPWHRGAFIRAIVDTVRAARPDFGRLTLGALDASAGAAYLGHVFAGELAHVDEPLYLIVDNAQVFAGDERFLKFVDSAVSELPDKVRILAVGRSLPEVALVKSFARRRVTILESDLLALDDDEIRAFARCFGRDLDDASLAQVARATEGWAAGVALTLATPNAMLPVTARQMLAELGRENRRFLEDTSVFETLDLRVLEQHEAFADARQHLADLRRRGALITHAAQDVYRVHPLLRELLIARVRARDAESAAHRTASESYARAGELSAALYHADAAEDEKTAADFLRTNVDAAFAAGDHDRLRTLMERIDPNGPDADVRLFTQGLFEKSAASGKARTAFEQAAQAAQASGEDAIAFNALAQILEYDIGRLASVDEPAVRDLEQRAERLGASAQTRVSVLRGWARAVKHEFAQALASIATLSGMPDALARFNVEILRAYVQTSLGQVEEAQMTLDALAEFLDDAGSTVLQTLTLVWFARLALLWGRTNVATDAMSQARHLAGLLRLRAEEAALFVALAETATHTGDVANAVRYAERARSSADRAWYAADVRRVNSFARIALARAAFLGHDNGIARDLALRVAADAESPRVQRALALAEASIYTLLCEPGAAAAVIAQAREALKQATPIDASDAVALSNADDILAFLDEANGDKHESLLQGCEPFDALLEFRRGLVTLELAGVAVGNARRGTADGTVAFETAMQLLERDGPRFEAQLARAYASTFIKSKVIAEPKVAGPELTTREHEILTLLVDGLSNKEIAQRLIVSPRTIETHVERVLGKLEVGSRSRAIAKAVRMGLVTLDAP